MMDAFDKQLDWAMYKNAPNPVPTIEIAKIYEMVVADHPEPEGEH